MEAHPTLQSLRDQRFFSRWDEFVDAERVAESEASVQQLIDVLLELGPKPVEENARAAVDACVTRFNDLDDGWICTMEREDICDAIHQVIAAAGFEPDDGWLAGRDW